MIVIFSHKQKFVQTESKNKFTIEPQPMFVNTLQRYEGFSFCFYYNRISCYFLLKKTKARDFCSSGSQRICLTTVQSNKYMLNTGISGGLAYPSPQKRLFLRPLPYRYTTQRRRVKSIPVPK